MKLFNIYQSILFASVCAVLMTACSEQELSHDNSSLHLPIAVAEKILELDGDPKDYQVSIITMPNGDTKSMVSEIGIDAAMSVDEFLRQSTKKQYRTQFLVDTDRFSIINIYAFVGAAPFGLSTQSRRALEAAVKNWNRVKRNAINFDIVYGTDEFVDYDVFEIAAFAEPNLGSSGLAEFPYSEGYPGSILIVDSESVNLGNWSADALEHIFTHELGHTIGFRHTDWQTRRSCVEAGVAEQEEAENFAEWLPWTKPNIPGILYQKNSIMNACFNINTTNGELNSNDKRGLQNMYFDPFDR